MKKPQSQCGVFSVTALGIAREIARAAVRLPPAYRRRPAHVVWKLTIAALCVLELSAAAVRLADAAPGDIHNLGTLGGTFSAAYDINDAGQVVGYAFDGLGRSRAFLGASGQAMTDLETATGYTEARAYGISASGAVVGVQYDNATGIAHAFSWAPNQLNGTTGTITSLTRKDTSVANALNDASHVVGSSTHAHFISDGSCTPDHPYYPNCGPGGTWEYETRAGLWENGVGSDLTSPSYILKTANDINNAGQVTGQTDAGHAFRHDSAAGSGGVAYDLGTLGGTTSIGNAINNAGEVVGVSATIGDAAQRAFRYAGTPGAGGLMVDLGALGGTSSVAHDVNDAGSVVGTAERAASAGGGSWATLWLKDGANTAIDLDAWLDAVNPALGAFWRLTDARGINNGGLITGQGIYDDGPLGLSDGDRAFILDASSLVSKPPIPGDFNGDDVVDSTDLASWKASFGAINATPAQGDADGDRDVDGADFLAWQRQYGSAATTLTTAAAVPEPEALCLLITAALATFARRDRKGSCNEWHSEISRFQASYVSSLSSVGSSACGSVVMLPARSYAGRQPCHSSADLLNEM